MSFEIGQKVRVVPTYPVYPNEEGVIIEREESIIIEIFLVRFDNPCRYGLNKSGLPINNSWWFTGRNLEHITDLEIAIREGRE